MGNEEYLEAIISSLAEIKENTSDLVDAVRMLACVVMTTGHQSRYENESEVVEDLELNLRTARKVW